MFYLAACRKGEALPDIDMSAAPPKPKSQRAPLYVPPAAVTVPRPASSPRGRPGAAPGVSGIADVTRTTSKRRGGGSTATTKPTPAAEFNDDERQLLGLGRSFTCGLCDASFTCQPATAVTRKAVEDVRAAWVVAAATAAAADKERERAEQAATARQHGKGRHGAITTATADDDAHHGGSNRRISLTAHAHGWKPVAVEVGIDAASDVRAARVAISQLYRRLPICRFCAQFVGVHYGSAFDAAAPPAAATRDQQRRAVANRGQSPSTAAAARAGEPSAPRETGRKLVSIHPAKTRTDLTQQRFASFRSTTQRGTGLHDVEDALDRHDESRRRRNPGPAGDGPSAAQGDDDASSDDYSGSYEDSYSSFGSSRGSSALPPSGRISRAATPSAPPSPAVKRARKPGPSPQERAAAKACTGLPGGITYSRFLKLHGVEARVDCGQKKATAKRGSEASQQVKPSTVPPLAVTRFTTGITFADSDGRGKETDSPVVRTAVRRAGAGGMLPADVVVRVGKTKTDTIADVHRAIAALPADKPSQFTVRRVETSKKSYPARNPPRRQGSAATGYASADFEADSDEPASVSSEPDTKEVTCKLYVLVRAADHAAIEAAVSRHGGRNLPLATSEEDEEELVLGTSGDEDEVRRRQPRESDAPGPEGGGADEDGPPQAAPMSRAATPGAADFSCSSNATKLTVATAARSIVVLPSSSGLPAIPQYVRSVLVPQIQHWATVTKEQPITVTASGAEAVAAAEGTPDDVWVNIFIVGHCAFTGKGAEALQLQEADGGGQSVRSIAAAAARGGRGAGLVVCDCGYPVSMPHLPPAVAPCVALAAAGPGAAPAYAIGGLTLSLLSRCLRTAASEVPVAAPYVALSGMLQKLHLASRAAVGKGTQRPPPGGKRAQPKQPPADCVVAMHKREFADTLGIGGPLAERPSAAAHLVSATPTGGQSPSAESHHGGGSQGDASTPAPSSVAGGTGTVGHLRMSLRKLQGVKTLNTIIRHPPRPPSPDTAGAQERPELPPLVIVFDALPCQLHRSMWDAIASAIARRDVAASKGHVVTTTLGPALLLPLARTGEEEDDAAMEAAAVALVEDINEGKCAVLGGFVVQTAGFGQTVAADPAKHGKMVARSLMLTASAQDGARDHIVLDIA